MTEPESLDIRTPRDAVRIGKKWTEVAAEWDRWRPGRVMAHMLNTTQVAGEPAQRVRRWWPWLLALYATPVAGALSVVAAWRLLRWGL